MAIVCSLCQASLTEADAACSRCGGEPEVHSDRPEVARYAELLRDFAADGPLDAGELADLEAVRLELGIPLATHEALLAKAQSARALLPLQLAIDEVALEHLTAGQQGAVRVLVSNAGERALRNVVVRFAVRPTGAAGECNVRTLRHSSPEVVSGVVRLGEPGQYLLELVASAEDLLGRETQHFRAETQAFRLRSASQGTPGLLPAPSWRPVPLRPLSARELESWCRAAEAARARDLTLGGARGPAQAPPADQLEALVVLPPPPQPSAVPALAWLLVHVGSEARSIPLHGTTTIGRFPDNTIRLLDSRVSKHHCALELRGGTFVVRDLGASNHTYVNGRALPEHGECALASGDELGLGMVRMRFRAG